MTSRPGGQPDLIPRQQLGLALLLFCGFLALFAAGPVYLLNIVKSGSNYYKLLFMWTPALAAFATLVVLKVRLSSLGWGGFSWRLAWENYLLPLAYCLPAYLLVWVFFSNGAAGDAEIRTFAKWLGLDPAEPNMVLGLSLFMVLTVGIINQLSATLGEEIGWRGLLTPLLMRRNGYWAAVLGTTAIWAAWHYMIIVHGHYNAGYDNLVAQFLNYSLMLFGLSLIMTYYRLKTNSLLPAVLLHAAHNMIVLGVYDEMTSKTKYSYIWAGEFGYLLPLSLLITGLIYYGRARVEGLTRQPSI